VSDLNIARTFGWRYEWVAELDEEVYQIVVEELVREQEERAG